MGLKLAFADLTHTNQGLSNNSFPFGISLIASSAKKTLGDILDDVQVFQYPEKFAEHLESENQDIVGFSNYIWTLDISHEFAKQIKRMSPKTTIVFGGPNYPIEKNLQKKFLEKYPAIDFYISGEGERAFTDFLKAGEKVDFDYQIFKNEQVATGNSHYLWNGEFIQGECLPRIEKLEEIPSPYLTGILDKFFDGVLTPIIQTTRGCPFTCTYCQEGQESFNQITRFSEERVLSELEYIAKKVEVPNLIIADSNFGMYPKDVGLALKLKELKEKNGWPKYIEASLGKNKKTVLDTVSALDGGILVGAPVQSTNPKVLENIKRRNISNERILEITQKGTAYGANSFSEIILGLPGDSKEAHFKSMLDMVDIGINVVRSHQLLMLTGSELSNQESRNKFDMQTRFRLSPRGFGNYEVGEEEVSASEIDELCVATNTLPYEDYLKCRSLDLTVELFHNNGIFKELTDHLNKNGIKTSKLIRKIEENVVQGSLNDIYTGFLKETEGSLWQSEEELEQHIKQPGMIKKYIEEELRNNEQLRYRALAFFEKMEELHDIAYNSATEILGGIKGLDAQEKVYLDELKEFSLAKKQKLLLLDKNERKLFHYDFVSLEERSFEGDYRDYFIPSGVNIEFSHSDSQKNLFSRYVQQFGSSINGLGSMLSRIHADKFYRESKKV